MFDSLLAIDSWLPALLGVIPALISGILGFFGMLFGL